MTRRPAKGRFGKFGGQFVPETLMPALQELESEYNAAKRDPAFRKELSSLLGDYAGRPTPLYLAENLTTWAGGAKIYLKREDLLHGGAHKINNTLGQALLSKRMRKSRIIAETGAGQHGVATAMACSVLGLRAEIYMGSRDIERQKLNVFRMGLLGAEVHSVESGSRTLKDAINEALRDWVTNLRTTHYLLGSAVGPHPYPMMVRDFQSVIGKEIRAQFRRAESGAPAALVACVGGGSNSIGTFHPFIGERGVRLYGVEAGGSGRGRNAAALIEGKAGVLHGMATYLLQDKDGQVRETESISAGLDYPGVGPEHSFLKETRRARYVMVTDAEALKAFDLLSKKEGIVPALESAHAVAFGVKLARKMKKKESVVITISGRGDKDVQIVAARRGGAA